MAKKEEKQESYQDLRAELDTTLASMRSGDLDIDEASQLYERAREIAEKLEEYIKTAENKVTKIKNDLI